MEKRISSSQASPGASRVRSAAPALTRRTIWARSASAQASVRRSESVVRSRSAQAQAASRRRRSGFSARLKAFAVVLEQQKRRYGAAIGRRGTEIVFAGDQRIEHAAARRAQSRACTRAPSAPSAVPRRRHAQPSSAAVSAACRSMSGCASSSKTSPPPPPSAILRRWRKAGRARVRHRRCRRRGAPPDRAAARAAKPHTPSAQRAVRRAGARAARAKAPAAHRAQSETFALRGRGGRRARVCQACAVWR